MSLVSMTGFGRGSSAIEDVTITVEVKTVNNRFADIYCKLPAIYSYLEPEIVKQAREAIKRGRAEILVSRVVGFENASEIKLNEANFIARLEGVKKACTLSKVDIKDVLPSFIVSVLSRGDILESDIVPGEVSKKEVDALNKALKESLSSLYKMRISEGARLELELSLYLNQLAEKVNRTKTRATTLPEQFKQRLHDRIKKLYGGEVVDAERLALEIAVLADRIDISEELTRLDSHLLQVKDEISTANGGGRKLEFILQEMLREVNTIGSKSQDSEISKNVIEMKTILEKFREQIQNIE